jgi:Flp pilus assembly protein TadD
LAATGQTHEAVLHYKEALRIRPNYVHAHNNLGVALTALGQFNDAMYHYTNALRLNPNSELVYNNLGALLAQQGQYELAIEHFNTAIKLNPHYPKPYFNLAFAMQKLGHPGTAVTNYTKALELDPAWPEALDKLAYLLAACPDRLWHNPSAAVKLAERAVRLTKSEVPDFIETLAFAYATCGNFSNAQAMAELAWKKANEKRLTQLAERLSADLEFYRAGQTPPKDWRNPM